MIIRNAFIILSLLFSFLQATAALTMAFVPHLEQDFYALSYNSAKLRQACIKVHGERWVKEKILLDRRFQWMSVFLSNVNFMEISCKRADPEDFMDLKAVIDYMANHNDTLYIDVENWEFNNIYSSSVALNEFIQRYTKLAFSSAVKEPMDFLRVGNTPDINNSNLIIMQAGHFCLGTGPDLGELLREYIKKCKNEGYIDVSHPHYDKEKVREKDINLYYDYIIASDKLILKTRPTRTIPIDVHYNYNPKENNIYIKWKYFKPFQIHLKLH